jgi:hypothetical protein
MPARTVLPGESDPIFPSTWRSDRPSKKLRRNIVGHLPGSQPVAQGFAVGNGGVPKAEKLPDLSVVVLDRPTAPIVLQILFKIDRYSNLFSQIADHIRGHFILGVGKAGFEGEDLSRMAKPRWVGPVLLASSSSSAGSRVQCSTSSSDDQLRFMAGRLLVAEKGETNGAAKLPRRDGSGNCGARRSIADTRCGHNHTWGSGSCGQKKRRCGGVADSNQQNGTFLE